MNGSLLQRVAELAGIETGYEDTWGNHHMASDMTLQALLHAMHIPADSTDQLTASLARLQARAGAMRHAPLADTAHAWRPQALAGDARRWGLSVQLYSVHTASTWGIGDFSALGALLQGAAALGACAVGVNPLHVLFPTRPEHASPYSPSSRRYINPLYLDVAAIEDYAACRAAREMVASASFQARLEAARAADQVPYRIVSSLKHDVLPLLYEHFRKHCLNKADTPRARAFRQFQHQQGQPLRRFAIFQVLAQSRVEMDWRQWPAGLDDPDSPAVAAFAAQHPEAIEYHEYLQWQADLQLQAVNAKARACGMGVGLYADLAVGSDPTGADCWGAQAYLVRDVTVGAPPDQLNLSGQNWGLPPYDPHALRAAGWAPMSELWSRNMHGAGALRIDHILGLMRLYWIPAGMSASEGAYVRYPWSELFEVLAAQSMANQCMVIGEDLGTVAAGLRETMRKLGMLSYCLLYFEQHDGRFRAPHEYPAEALVSAGTHDLPPLAMWWSGGDIALREELGLWPREDMRQAELAERERDRMALVAALRGAGIEPPADPSVAPVGAVHAYLARTPCKLLMVQLEDVLGVRTQVNVPGTTDQHPNWRRRLPCSIEAALAHPRMQRIAAELNAQGRVDR